MNLCVAQLIYSKVLMTINKRQPVTIHYTKFNPKNIRPRRTKDQMALLFQ